MYYCLTITFASTILTIPAMYESVSKYKCYVAYVQRTSAFRSFIKWADRNHLTNRSREDVFYNTNRTLDKRDTILSCFNTELRQKVRPKNFIRKILFDAEHSEQPDEIILHTNLSIRRAFRHMSLKSHQQAIDKATAAPANNHSEAAISRNAASNMLTQIKQALNDQVVVFSLSGSVAEQKFTDGAFRGRYNPADCAQPALADKAITPAAELISISDTLFYPTVMVSTDTTNHVTPQEKNGILGNGVSIVSYNPTPMINNRTDACVDKERISFWLGNKLHTNVNGGGDYIDEIWDTNYDILAAECPDGDLMLVYVDSWLDLTDPTHSFFAEVPFCKIHRRSDAYDIFKSTPPVRRLVPLNFHNKCNGAELQFSSLSIKHAETIQVTNNTTRETEYFTRSELVTLAGASPGRYIHTLLSRAPPNVNGIDRDPARRRAFIEQVGLHNCTRMLNSPEFNVQTPLEDSIHAAALRLLMCFISDPNVDLEKALDEAPPAVSKMATTMMQTLTSTPANLSTGWDAIQNFIWPTIGKLTTATVNTPKNPQPP